MAHPRAILVCTRAVGTDSLGARPYLPAANKYWLTKENEFVKARTLHFFQTLLPIYRMKLWYLYIISNCRIHKHYLNQIK